MTLPIFSNEGSTLQIDNFNDLLRATRYQPLPQRLLFVFAAAELPADSTAKQTADFAAGLGGALTPLMCVDKSPQELDSFSALCQEAKQFEQPWGMVFAAALSGSPGHPPDDHAVELALQRMVQDIKQGQFGTYIPFDLRGDPVLLG
jgi:hypothetical protein